MGEFNYKQDSLKEPSESFCYALELFEKPEKALLTSDNEGRGEMRWMIF